MSEELTVIDGATMEGGGQILRMSIAFSALLKKPIKIFNIRAGRSSPGLRPQHLAGLQLVRDLSCGRLIGDQVGSTEVTFHPGTIKRGKYYADPGTAGSIMLLFQVSLPCLLFADGPSELDFKGGTNAEMAPQIDHTLMVFQPIIERMGVTFNCNIRKRGYFPKGGGHVFIKVNPAANYIEPLELLNPGEVVEIKGKSFVAGVLPVKMAHSMADAASQLLRKSFPGVTLKVDRMKEPVDVAVGNGSGIVLAIKTSTNCLLGASSLGKRNVSTESVGEAAAKDLLKDYNSGSCVDHYVQDQLVIFMALAKGKSKVKIGPPTLHTKTAIFVAELLTQAKFTLINEDSEGHCIMECEGIGLER